MDAIAESDALHARVQRSVDEAPSTGDFEALALEIFDFQMRHQTGLRRLADAASGVKTLEDIPAVPVEVFRYARVAVHPAALDLARFETSGTTGGRPGVHVMRRLDTYQRVSLAFARRAFGTIVERRPRVLALAPEPRQPNTSSLSQMMRYFMTAFDGDGEAWLIDDEGIDLGRLELEIERATSLERPVLVLATSFALVGLCDRLAERSLVSPPGSVVMQTGGFKGKTREVPAAELKSEVSARLGIARDAVIAEYGMTELTSQLYEATAPGATIAGPTGVYVEPPWLRVTPVDPLTMEPVSTGEEGLARIVDLANVDSALAIVTEDLVRRTSGGIQLLGRRKGATPRGCSLPFERLLQRALDPAP